ncbi:MAG TPA: STAS domain-containing protein [Candidatus Saccharimonadales bacterium]|nr:STAS domain-containing protein [Candidatus Saccharimonadales bacterium]
MSLALASARRSFAFDRPVFQWDARHGTGPLIVRLFGRLGPRELRQMVQAIRERGRSPRDLVCLDFEQVTHLDYRGLPEFARALARQQSAGADVVLTGMSGYVRRLFDVAGQGPTLRRLEWKPVEESEAPRRPTQGIARLAPHHPATRRDLMP